MIESSAAESVNGSILQRGLYLLAGTVATLALQLASGFLGPAGMLLNLLAPVPAAFACMMMGGGIGGGIVVLTTAALAAVSGPAGSLAYLLQFGLGSLLLPLLLRRGWGWDRAAALTLVVVIGTATLVVGGYLLSSGQPFVETVDQYVKLEIKKAFEIYATADLSESQRTELSAIADFMGRIYPGAAVAVTGAMLLLTTFLLSALSRRRYAIPGTPFPLWKAPEHFIWLLIGGGFGSLLADGWLQIASWNLLAIALLPYFLQGLAVVSYFFIARGFSPLMRGIGYLLVAVFNPFQLLVACIGVFDLWIDFRKPRIKKT